MARILAIETSCDETAAAVVEDRCHVLSSVIASQDDVHARFGGVVPELASRRHLECIGPVVAEALERAGTTLERIDAIAVTCGPGLVGSLLVGVCAAKAIAWSRGLPLIGVNHLEGHVRSPFLTHPGIPFPAMALVVSGGHTALYRCPEEDVYELVARTRDDACVREQLRECAGRVAARLEHGMDERHANAIDLTGHDLLALGDRALVERGARHALAHRGEHRIGDARKQLRVRS